MISIKKIKVLAIPTTAGSGRLSNAVIYINGLNILSKEMKLSQIILLMPKLLLSSSKNLMEVQDLMLWASIESIFSQKSTRESVSMQALESAKNSENFIKKRI